MTDGRFSGATAGWAAVGHVSPEAAEGGPIALIQEGDLIEIDIPRGVVHLHVSDEELAAKKSGLGEAETGSRETRQLSISLCQTSDVSHVRCSVQPRLGDCCKSHL